MDSIVESVRQERVHARVSQRRLARLTGVSQSTISRFESGMAAGMRIDRLAAILAALGLEVRPGDRRGPELPGDRRGPQLPGDRRGR